MTTANFYLILIPILRISRVQYTHTLSIGLSCLYFQYLIIQSAYSLPNYRAQFLEYKDLDKIHIQPTIDSISRLLRQFKRNAKQVSTALGGSQLGSLALFISADN